jgi:hypothetical protein
MVQAENATLTFVGINSKKPYYVDMYASDVAGAKCTFNPSGAAVATSTNFWVAPEDVALVDISIVTGLTSTVGFTPTSNDSPLSKYSIRWANFVNTIQSRPKLAIGFRAGNNIGMTQF